MSAFFWKKILLKTMAEEKSVLIAIISLEGFGEVIAKLIVSRVTIGFDLMFSSVEMRLSFYERSPWTLGCFALARIDEGLCKNMLNELVRKIRC